MNDEIKKILDDLLFTTTLPNVSVKLSEEKLYQLKDYVTNLQNKYENQIHRYMNLKEQTTNLQEENERLTRFKYNIPNDKTQSVPTITKSYENEYKDYKSRCEKADEKLNKLDFDNFVYSKTALKDIKKNLQNILNGGDENEKK